jgi:rhamnosyltransferase
MTDHHRTSPVQGPRIAGVVVLYECDADIIGNMSTYADDLDMLLIVDNSAAPTPAVEAVAAAHRDAAYVFNGANLGVAAALNIGAEWARERGAAFLLTMDQDSGFHQVPFRAFRDCVLSLPFLDDLAVAAPTFLAGFPPSTDCIAIDRDTVITSGNMVHLANHGRIGPFDEHLFIDEVDHDYCLRARDLGLRVVELPAIRLQHRLGQSRTVSVLGKRVQWNVHGPIRHYYMVRNGLYMLSKHRRRHLRYCLGRLGRLTRTVAAALLLAPDKRKRFNLVAQGVRDYFQHRMGARKPTIPHSTPYP